MYRVYEMIHNNPSLLASPLSPRGENVLYNSAPDAYIFKVKKWHQSNFDSVTKALEEAGKQLRNTIAKTDDENLELTFTRLYSMIMGIWIESRIHVLLYENKAFTELERAIIYNKNSLEDKWNTALIIAVKKSVRLPLEDELTEDNCDFSIYNIYKKISGWINKYFSETITYRNKIAHGQWIYPFTSQPHNWENSSDFKISSEISKGILIRYENFLSITERGKLLKAICAAINNLATQRRRDYKVQDFNVHFQIISRHINKLSKINYEEYRNDTRQSYLAQQQKNIHTP
ncbi:hypothetical protein CQA25_15290 [Morganella morganii]|nr:hypothetical protein MC49_006945 [Morganella morganii]PCP72107.1 hypothetical protein CQA25_15290 [Morganella morganii]